MRAAFGTYMDKEVAALILPGQFPEEGTEVDVSIMFCDIRGFTSYAERAAATEVVAKFDTRTPLECFAVAFAADEEIDQLVVDVPVMPDGSVRVTGRDPASEISAPNSPFLLSPPNPPTPHPTSALSN